MGGRITKWVIGGAILGSGLWLTDQLYFGLVHPRLPEKFTNWVSMSKGRVDAYRYGVAALGTMVILPLTAGLIGLSGKSPLKDGSSPVKA